MSRKLTIILWLLCTVIFSLPGIAMAQNFDNGDSVIEQYLDGIISTGDLIQHIQDVINTIWENYDDGDGWVDEEILDYLDSLFDLIIANQPPTADAGNHYSVDEGNTFTLNGSATDPEGDSLTYSWDLNNNGSFERRGKQTQFSAVNRDGFDTQVIALRVCDVLSQCDVDYATVRIRNVAPRLVAGDNISVNSGDFIIVNATIIDPGRSDSHTATINFGDGPRPANVNSATNQITGEGVYYHPGIYRPEVCVSDNDGEGNCTRVTIGVTPLIVDIQTRPYQDDKVIPLSFSGTVAVAIMGTENLDVRNIDTSSVTFAGAPVATWGWWVEHPMAYRRYINDDRIPDLLVYFQVRALHLPYGPSQAMLRGRTHDYITFEATDTVSLVPSRDATILLSPPDGSIHNQSDIFLTWFEVPGTVCHLYQVDNNPDFSSPEYTETLVNSYGQLKLQVANGQYYWRVRAGGKCKSVQPGPWSGVWSFTVEAEEIS